MFPALENLDDEVQINRMGNFKISAQESLGFYDLMKLNPLKPSGYYMYHMI
jgi:hypothetical protein